ncbi:MAG: FKBP-type peptidyl-prolyl cis-trans isomerase [Bacteroidales bacterium]|nr:FKBP-type peptidyl-prolyl cis-trans isomerase [Bacteroidales bacterium]
METRSIFISLVFIVMAIAISSCKEGRTNEDQEREIQKFIEKFELEHQHDSLKFTKTESGLYYCILEEGVGENAHEGQIIDYLYAAKMLDKINWYIAYTEPDDLDDVKLGVDPMIEGVKEAFTYMNVGCELYAIIPSNLGYGDYSFYTDPYTPWLYWLKIVELRNPDDDDDDDDE